MYRLDIIWEGYCHDSTDHLVEENTWQYIYIKLNWMNTSRFSKSMDKFVQKIVYINPK